MSFLKTPEGKILSLCFIIFFITCLSFDRNFLEAFLLSLAVVVSLIPLTMVIEAYLGTFLEIFNINFLKKISFDQELLIIFLIELFLMANHFSDNSIKKNQTTQTNINYNNNQNNLSSINYNSNINNLSSSPSVSEKSDNGYTKIINGIIYNLIPISATETVYLTIPIVDSNGYKVNGLNLNYNISSINNLPIIDSNDTIMSLLGSEKDTTIAITPTNCSVFNKRLNNQSSLNPKMYLDGQLIDIFNQKSGIEIAKYICNYGKYVYITTGNNIKD